MSEENILPFHQGDNQLECALQLSTVSYIPYTSHSALFTYVLRGLGGEARGVLMPGKDKVLQEVPEYSFVYQNMVRESSHLARFL